MVLWPPMSEDLREGLPSTSEEYKKPENTCAKGEVTEAEKQLSSAMEEMKVLQSKLATMERYASILHGAIYGRPFEVQDIPASLHESGSFNIAKEWENMLESADHAKLMRLEMFYKNMLAGVKDKLMKRRIQDIILECLQSSTTRPN